MRIKPFVAGLGLMAATPLSAAWQEASSRHFVVYADDTPANVAAYATKLERFDKALRVLRDTRDEAFSPLARVTVFVVPAIRDVQKLAGRGEGNVAGFYIPRASQTVAFVPRKSGDEDFSALTILLHEYGHHFMFSNYSHTAYPAWIVEGFAEFNATALFRSDGGITLGAPANYRAYGMLDKQTIPIEKLLTVAPGDLKSDMERQTFYGRAWLLTHYMTMDPVRRDQLSAYFKALNEGKPAAQAMLLLGDPKKLDYQLNTYAKQRTLQALTLKAAALPIEAVKVRPLSAGEAAVMPARIASSRGVDRKTAPGIADLARRLAQPYPDDPAVQDVLAEAEYDAGHFAAAQAAADRALARDPKSVHALIYEGLSRGAAAHEAKVTDATIWSGVRGWYVKANHLEPEYAYPLELYYRSFVSARQAPPKSAQAGLLYAHELAPFDLGLGLNAAMVALQQNKVEDAKVILRPIAYNPHAGELAKAAAKVLALIDEKGAADAAAALGQGDEAKDGPAS